MIVGGELNVMSLIGIILLIGIVKKNAIMMIDFAVAAQRIDDMPAKDAIFTAAILRFRPIMMTTMAAFSGRCRSPSVRGPARSCGVLWALPSWAVCSFRNS